MNKKVVNLGLMDFIEDNVKSLTEEMEWMKERTLKYAENIEEVKSFVDKAIEKGLCAVDLETTGLNTRTKDGKPIEKIVGVGLSYDSNYGLYIPINHKEDPEYNLPEELVLEEIKRLCMNCITVYHNAKFDLTVLKNYGIIVDDHNNFEDTQLLARCYDLGQKDVKLKNLSDRLLGQKMLTFEDVVKNTKRFDFISPKVGYVYGASDPVCTLDLYNFFMEQDIVKNQMLIYKLEKRNVFVVMEMESNLVKINLPYLMELKEKTEKRIAEIKREVFKIAKEEFNLGSPQQLGKILFEKLKYDYPEKNKTASGQYKTDNTTLAKIADVYPVVNNIMEFRGLEKILGTYINNLIANHDENDYVKLGFHQSGTDTGRFSSPGGMGINLDGYSGVNVQSTPKIPPEENPYLDMRKAFIARLGKTIVAIDYENEEMRIATNLSKETTWIEAINKGVDFHTATGSIITGKDLEDVTASERKTAKTVNFLSLYLGGPRTLSGQAKISFGEAKKILKTFFAGVPRLKKWMDREIYRSRRSKIVKTAFGRIRPLDKFYGSGDKALEAHGDRCAINTQVQGAAADLMKIVMAKLYSWIHRNNFQDDIKMLITMHDELVFEITTEKLEFYIPEIAKIMMLDEVISGQLKWEIPLTVDIKYGNSWRVKKKFFEEFPEAKQRLSKPLFESEGARFDRYSAVKENSKEQPEKLEKENLKTKDIEENKEKSQDIVQSDVSEKEKELSQKEETKEEIKQELSESIPIDSDNDSPYLIYTIRDRRESHLRWLNSVLQFLIEENKDIYSSQKKILRLKDTEGNSLLISEYEVPVDCFVALARYHDL